MTASLRHDRIVRVSTREFRCRVHRQPQWCGADGWKGLALHVELADEPQRALILELPFKRAARRSTPHRQRPAVSEADLVADIANALAAGWDPESRGKPFVFEVERI